MPGALVIMNAIQSLFEYGQMQEPPIWVMWLIELMMILLMAWAFARFSSFRGSLVAGGVILLFLLPFSFYFFKLGVWVDFAIPLLGMEIHQLIAAHDERLMIRNKLEQLHTQNHPNKPIDS